MGISRFHVIYRQGGLNTAKIIVDEVTGVQYLLVQSGYGAGLTPLLDRDGKPVIAQTGGSVEW